MSLSPREHEILGRIASELTGSDPKLASLAAGFNRLMAGEEMPSRSRLASVRRARRRARYQRRTRHSVRASWFVAAVWFITSLGMIAVALVLTFVTPAAASTRGCGQWWAPASCSGTRAATVPAPSARSGS